MMSRFEVFCGTIVNLLCMDIMMISDSWQVIARVNMLPVCRQASLLVGLLTPIRSWPLKAHKARRK